MTASPEEKSLIEASYDRLVSFYELPLVAWGGDRETWAARVQAFSRDGEPNAYYDWVLGR